MYIGQWQENMSHGKGVLHHKDPDGQLTTYEGEWSRDRQDGLGVETCGSSRFEGQFRNGQKDG